VNQYSVLVGNFRRGYLLVDHVGMRVLPNPYSVPGKVSFYCSRRSGGCVLNNDAIKALKISLAWSSRVARGQREFLAWFHTLEKAAVARRATPTSGHVASGLLPGGEHRAGKETSPTRLAFVLLDADLVP